ncbi:CAP domain-containing protein [Streptomyces olivoreticuli]
MGRHRRSAPQATGHPAAAPPPTRAPSTNGRSDPGPLYEPEEPTDVGRHRNARRRGRVSAPVRTGLLGASAAMAMGVVAMASGLFSGGDTLQLGGGSPGGQVRADDPPALQSGPVRPQAPAPAPERGGLPVSRGTERPEARSAPPADAPPPPSEPSAEAPSPRPGGSGIDPGSQAHTLPAPVPGTADADPPATDPGAGPGTATEAVDLQATPVAQILALVNQERAKVGARPLAPSPRLTSLAQSFSDDMARRGFFAHTDPDGRTPWDRAARHGIGNLGGENIARGQPDPRAVMEAWMHSTGHRANILNREYRTLGIGVNPGSGGPWWTQDFGF